MSILFICPHTGQPRYHKRESSLRTICDTRVAAFRRPYYRDNTFCDGVTLIDLGELQNRQYAARLPRFWKAARRIRSAKAPGDTMYAFNVDSYMLGRLAGLGRGILEIGDLRAIDSRNPVIRASESLVLRDCLALVVTSPGFLSGYYDEFTSKRCPTYVIENKLSSAFRVPRPRIEFDVSQKIRIGLIGLLRYRRPIEMLVRAVKENWNLHLMCYGDGPDRDVVTANAGERIEYLGPFRNPQDLERIYKSVDVNFVVYDSDSKNVRLALPNKYYESVFFGVPILAAQGTELGRQVMATGVGGVVDTSSYESFMKGLSDLTRSWLADRKQQCFRVPEGELIDNGQEVLARMLKELSIRE